MSNVLNLKNTSPPQRQEPQAPVAEETVVSEESSDDAFVMDNFEPREVSCTASVRPDALERKKGLYMIGTLGALAVGTAYFTQSIFLAVIAGLTIFAWEVHHRAHDEHEVHIHKAGVRMNGHDYPFRALHSFAIHEMPDETRHLSLRTTSRFTPHLRVPLGDLDHEEVRTALAYHIDEDEHPVPLSEIFLKS